MCDICRKVEFVIETMESLFDDNTMNEHIEEIGLDKTPGCPDDPMLRAQGARLSLLLLAAAELALKYRIKYNDMFLGLKMGMERAAIRDYLKENDPEFHRLDGVNRKMRDYES